MGIKIEEAQARKILGIPVDQCYIYYFLLERAKDGDNTPFSCKVKFVMAMKTDDGKYELTRREEEIKVSDIEAYTILRAQSGFMQLANADAALQLGIADLIASQKADMTTASVV